MTGFCVVYFHEELNGNKIGNCLFISAHLLPPRIEVGKCALSFTVTSEEAISLDIFRFVSKIIFISKIS
jgi:hypothetical protein